MALKSSYEGQSCSMARALGVLGERWTLLIVRDAFHGLTRYDEFQRSLGIATNVLSSRLQKLVGAGVLEQEEPRGGYHLTAKGRDLYPVLLTLIAWADTHEPGPEGPEVEIRHVACDHAVGPALRCAHCGDPVLAEDIRLQPASGTLTPPQLAAWGPARD